MTWSENPRPRPQLKCQPKDGTALAFSVGGIMTVKRARACTYVASLDPAVSDSELPNFAAYLSTLSLAGCEVIVIDSEGDRCSEERRRVLRWVSRYVAGPCDLMHTAIDLATSEKIIVASQESRYTAADVAAICDLLDAADVVAPEEFVHPLPWWGAIDAGSMLLQRGLDASREGGTFAFRRSAWHPIRALEMVGTRSPLRMLTLHGASVHVASDVFVRREPPKLSTWARLRANACETSAAVTAGAALLACVLPLVMVVAAVGGYELAGGYAGLIAAGSMLVAVRGRAGARRFFPMRICFFAPLAIVERSLGVYWALFARLRRTERVEPRTAPEAASRRMHV